MKRIALIGHRGVGKSSLLKRIQTYFKNDGAEALCLDLDSEIEKRAGKTVQEIFTKEGEEAFREIERKTFLEFDRQTASEVRPLFLALGAGFAPERIPEAWKTLWVRRTTDADGRIFLDRPRLNAKIEAIAEFHERYEKRQAAFQKRADEILWLDEGLDEAPETAERDFILNRLASLGGAITILPEQFRSDAGFREWLECRLQWGVQRFELRDDLLSEAQIESVLQILPANRTLISARAPKRLTHTVTLIERYSLPFDWPLEYGKCTFAQPRFFSLHERKEGQSIAEALERFPKKTPGTCFKAALPTWNFHDLFEGHQWRHADSQERVFLPMSKDGRWSWYRLFEGGRSELSFFREGDGTSADQPTLLQWARLRDLNNSVAETLNFAAVLGDPVRHSRTPLEQKSFFATQGVPVFAVRVSQEEWRDGALETLRALGLRWSAVTAPLKELAFAACTERVEPSDVLGSVNTIDRRQGGWRGTNTDLEGFRVAVNEVAQDALGPVAVWGGGGTLSTIAMVLPKAEFFSSRTRENRNSSGVRSADFKPGTIIWAGGGSLEASQRSSQMPPPDWRPRRVLDLNYKEDSPARAYALSVGCRYISGLAMFRAQAEAQRNFWKTELST